MSKNLSNAYYGQVFYSIARLIKCVDKKYSIQKTMIFRYLMMLPIEASISGEQSYENCSTWMQKTKQKRNVCNFLPKSALNYIFLYNKKKEK